MKDKGKPGADTAPRVFFTAVGCTANTGPNIHLELTSLQFNEVDGKPNQQTVTTGYLVGSIETMMTLRANLDGAISRALAAMAPPTPPDAKQN